MNRDTMRPTERTIVCPPISRALLEYLAQIYPDKLPSNTLTISDRELGAKVGQQQVIQHLQGMFRIQEEDNNVL